MTVRFHLPGLRQNFPLNMLVLSLLEQKPERFREGIEIASFFGEFPASLWNGGRPSNYDQCDEAYVRNVIKAINDKGIPVRYTYTNMLLGEEELKDPWCNFCMRAADNGMNEVIVFSPILEEYVRKTYPSFKLNSSTCKEIRDIDAVNEELDKDYHLVVLDYNLNNCWDKLELIKDKERCEILVNAVCVPNCPRRGEHYRNVARNQRIMLENRALPQDKQLPLEEWECEYGEHNCLYTIQRYNTYVSPEAIWEKYVPMGFTNFKIEGRTANLFSLIETYCHYLIRPEYQGETRIMLLNNLVASKVILLRHPREVFPGAQGALRPAAGSVGAGRSVAAAADKERKAEASGESGEREIFWHLPGFCYFRLLNQVVINMMRDYPDMFHRGYRIGSVYGTFPGAIWNGGRTVFGVTGKQDMESILQVYNKRGIPVRFTWTNSLLEEKHLQDNYCNMIMRLADNGLNQVLVNTPVLENYIRENYPGFPLISSTTKRITDEGALLAELDKDYFLVVLDYDLNHDEAVLKALEPHANRVELLVNEVCHPGCARRSEHYRQESLMQLEYDVRTSFPCPHNTRERSFEDCKGQPAFISNEEIAGLAERGFVNFKIVGRGMPQRFVEDAYLYYLVKEEHRDFVRSRIDGLMQQFNAARQNQRQR